MAATRSSQRPTARAFRRSVPVAAAVASWAEEIAVALSLERTAPRTTCGHR